MRRTLPTALLLFTLLVACGTPAAEPTAPSGSAAAPVELTVFAAASLTQAFEAIGARFEADNPGVRVVHSFAGSQQLAQQLAQGAPADVFASANGAQMDAAIAAGRVTSGTAQVFARNRLVLVCPQDNPGGIQSLADLARPGVRLVLADKAVPAGRYALQLIDKAAQLPEYTQAYSAGVTANVVSYEENVRAVLAKVALGEADAGIVYVSDVAGADAKVRSIEIPAAVNVEASYPIAPLADSGSPDVAARYIAFVLSPQGQAILTENGFVAADD